MNFNSQSYRLSSGFRQTRAGRLTVLVLLGVLGIGAAGCLGAILGMFVLWALSSSGADSRTLFNVVMFGLPVLLATTMTGWMVRNVLVVLRSAAWLDGTRLTVQRIRPRTVDLATAHSVVLRPSSRRFTMSAPGVTRVNDERIPELLVVGPEGTVRLMLAVDTGAPLPQADLFALANVLSTVRRPGAAEVAQELHALAARAPQS
ncbi:hypothetical protein E0H26_19165 [Micromonospora zingiberis]|uniref:Uncharacterized protein n=1 Tax=Micromonospora zingiberis TaxID=2053011 RepID=A0A4R0GEB5_9ACTN|nr:hypothetical protein [Micromonospora zingiberis]TCB95584.1 hypothetical protein E0H26_19165 [Micromonospora zingiberis]